MQAISLIIEDDMSFDNLKKNRVVPLYYTIPLLVVCLSALAILIFVFNLEDSILLQPIIPVNVNACGALSLNDTYYVLNTNINFSGAECFVIDAYNSTLDGNSQFKISGNNTPGTSAVIIKGNGNTIRGLNITAFSNGIVLQSANNTLVTLNEITYSGNISIYSISSISNNLTLNALSYFGRSGVNLKFSALSNIFQNKIYGPITAPALSYGVEIDGGYGHNVSNNLINSSLLSLSLSFTGNNFFFNNNLIGASGIGIYSIFNSEPNKFINNYVSNSALRGVYLSNSYNSYFKNITILGTGLLFVDLETTGLSNSLEIVDSSLKKYAFNNSALKFYNSSNSRINFTQNITETGNDLGADIKLRFNYVDVNSASKPGLDKSAIVSFEGIPNNIVNAIIYRNGVVCHLSVCSNLTILNAGNVLFNVNGWSNYSIGAGPVGYPTLDIQEPDSNEVYSTGNFPLDFIIDLTQNGTAWFSLNNGSTNITMNTTNNLRYKYTQLVLSVGNYTFNAYANFTGTNLRDNRSVKFKVVNSVVPGNVTPPIINNATPQNQTPIIPPPNNEQTIKIGNNSASTSSGNNSPVGFKYVAYWLVVSIIAILIVILIFLIIKAIQSRSVHQNTIPGSIVSQLR